MQFRLVYGILKSIKETSGSNAKKEIIKSHDFPEIKEVYKWLFDNSRVGGIAKKKWEKVEPTMMDELSFGSQGINSIVQVFKYLDEHNTGRDCDVAWCKLACKELCISDEEEAMFAEVITKTLVIGCDASTVNKVFPMLVPTFDVMLADKYLDLDQKKLDKISCNGTREFVLQEKLDGFRCIAIKEEGKVKFVSRQGKLYEGLVDLEKALETIPEDNFVLDGELIVTNRNEIPSGDQYKATSKLVTTKEPEKHGVTLNVFDYMPLYMWIAKETKFPYTDRYATLFEMFNKYGEILEPSFTLVPLLHQGTDLSVVLKELAKARSNNWEGIMLRWSDSEYEFDRSTELLKVKPMKEMDVIIDGYEEGDGKYVGMLGAFICHVEHPEFGHLEMHVGGGYSDDERKSYWENRDNLVGRVLEMQYFEVTENTTTHQKSVRFPVHKCIKEANTTPNN